MGTLSLWKAAVTYRRPLEVWAWGGPFRPCWRWAEGVLFLDLDAPLKARSKELEALRWKILRHTRVEVADRVLAGKAYALGVWAIGAFQEAGTNGIPAVAAALARCRDVPLLGQDPVHQPGDPPASPSHPGGASGAQGE